MTVQGVPYSTRAAAPLAPIGTRSRSNLSSRVRHFPSSRLPAFRASLDPLRRTVERQDFVAGKSPAYADYIAFGAFQWARAISDFELLAADDPVRTWRKRMLGLFGGLAGQAPAYGS